MAIKVKKGKKVNRSKTKKHRAKLKKKETKRKVRWYK